MDHIWLQEIESVLINSINWPPSHLNTHSGIPNTLESHDWALGPSVPKRVLLEASWNIPVGRDDSWSEIRALEIYTAAKWGETVGSPWNQPFKIPQSIQSRRNKGSTPDCIVSWLPRDLPDNLLLPNKITLRLSFSCPISWTLNLGVWRLRSLVTVQKPRIRSLDLFP